MALNSTQTPVMLLALKLLWPQNLPEKVRQSFSFSKFGCSRLWTNSLQKRDYFALSNLRNRLFLSALVDFVLILTNSSLFSYQVMKRRKHHLLCMDFVKKRKKKRHKPCNTPDILPSLGDLGKQAMRMRFGNASAVKVLNGKNAGKRRAMARKSKTTAG